jgi:Fe-S-cluster containining protein
MGAQERLRILDKFWPVGGEQLRYVPAKPTGECKQCGRCCALIRISFDYEFIIERARHWIRYIEENGHSEEAMTYREKELKEGLFIITNWERVPRDEAVRRGFRPQVDSGDFFYHCKLLNEDGTCSVHGSGQPPVCTGYPFYHAKTNKQKRKAVVFKGCGFGDNRFKGKTFEEI